MTEQDETEVMHRFRLFMGVAVITVAVLTVGQFTGHYRGFYAQSDIALGIQAILIFALMASMLISAWRADAKRNSVDLEWAS